jgi:molybdopterin/thiamine biosynthesis adenylyltransferase
MRATSYCATWAGPDKPRSGARVSSWSAPAVSARRCCSTSPPPGSARSASSTNLQRQVIHATPDVGMAKVDSAAAVIHRLNPHVAVEQHPVRLAAQNALDLLGRYDLIADGSDNFATRYLVSDACYFANKPLVTAALGAFDGTLTTIRAHEKGADGKPNPTYRCLFPEPPPPGTVPTCAEAGILGALAGVVGSMAALEVIREIVGFGEGLVGRLVMLDASAMRFETLRYAWDPANPLTGEKPIIKDLSGHVSVVPSS